MDDTIHNWVVAGVQSIIVDLTLLEDNQYVASLSIFIDDSSDIQKNITLITDFVDQDKYKCAISVAQLLALLFGPVVSEDVFVIDSFGDIVEEFTLSAAIEILYPHLRSSETIH